MRRALLSPRVLAVLLTSIALLTTAGGGVASAEHSAKGPSLSPRSSIELQTIIDVNNARAARGLGQLYADPTLGSLARERSTDMAANNYFSHYAPDGSAFYVQLLDSNHVQFQFAGENLAWSTYGDDVSAQTAVDGWIASPAHAENLFNGRYSRAGIGVVSADGKKYFTMIFVGT